MASLFAKKVAVSAVCAAAAMSLSTTGAAAPTKGNATTIESEPTWIRQMQNNREFAKEIAATNNVDWCQTERAFFRQNPASLNNRACTTYAAGDTPSVRDANIPTSSTPIKTVRIYFNVFRNSDGTLPAATAQAVTDQVAQLNADFAASRIQFSAGYRFVDSTTYRQFADSEETAMKSAFSSSPSTQLNVFVVNIQGGYLGVGTFPWESDATSAQGGLIIDDNYFGAGQKTLTHEVGHCLGLWHTHHGVSEVTSCSACWERADGLNGNTTGDFCSDTPPTPVNYNCSPPGGTDSCSSTAWGATQPQNYMGYAPDSCYTLFTPQQAGRMHWYIANRLGTWMTTSSTPTPTPTPTPTATATATPTATPATGVLTSGVAVTGSVATGAWAQYTINVPAGSSQMVVALTGTGGDADLYVRKAGVPTTAVYDYRPYLSGSNETVTITNTSTPTPLGSGTWYIGVRAYTGPAPFTLRATITAGATPTATPTPTPTATATATATATPTPTPTGSDAFESDNTSGTAKSITVNGSTQTRNISPNTDEDWIVFTNSTTRNIRIETNGPTNGDTIIYLYNSSLTLITSDDDSGAGFYSLISRASLPAGTYYIKVQSYNKASSITGYTTRVYTY